MKVDISNYICSKPFHYIQVFEDHLEGCCWDWSKVRSTNGSQSLQESWEELEWYRQKSLRSPLLTCTLECPFLRKLQDTGDTQGIFIKKDIGVRIDSPKGPSCVRVTCDDSCNLCCKTCRDRKKEGNYELTVKKLKEIQELWGEDLEQIQLLGSGDPIYSKAVREFLMEFDSTKFPKLGGFYLHTNGQLLTEKLWKEMKAAPYIRDLEISVDAATEKTYEKIRRGGKWKTLLENVDFLTKQSSIRYCCCSFVVQKDNYFELEDFYRLFKPFVMRTGRSWEIGFNRVMPWGGISKAHFDNLNIFENETAVSEIKCQLNRIGDTKHIRTNIEYLDNNYAERKYVSRKSPRLI